MIILRTGLILGLLDQTSTDSRLGTIDPPVGPALVAVGTGALDRGR